MHNELKYMSRFVTVPSVYINGAHLGGYDDTLKAFKTGKFRKMMNKKSG